MKRYTSILLVIAIVSTLFSVPAFSANSSIDFLITDTFDSELTGSIPSKASVDGTPVVTVVEEGKNKALELSGSASGGGVYYSVAPTDDNVTFWAEIKNSAVYSRFNIYVNDNAGKSQTLISLSDDGKLSSYEPRVVYGFSKGRFTSIQLTYNSKHKKLSLYVNGKKVFYERYSGPSAVTSVSGFGIKCDGKEGASVLLDNVAIYNGKAVLKDSSLIPKAAYNHNAAETDISSDAAPQVGSTVFLNRTFDEEDMGYKDGYDIFDNTDVTHETGLLDGNKYIRLAKNTNAQAYIQYRASADIPNIVVDMKLSLDSDMDTATGNLIYAYESIDGQLVLTPYVRIYSGGRIAAQNGTTVAALKKYKWTNLVFAADFSSRNYDIYVDGELVLNDIPLPFPQNQGMGVIRTGFEAHSIMGAVLIDDLKVYEGTEPRIIEGSVKKNVLPDDTLAQRYLGSMKAIGLHSDAVYNGREKIFTQNEIVFENKNTYMHEADLKTLFGENATPTGAYSKKDGYYSADETAKALNYQRFEYEARAVIYSPSVIELSEEQLDTIHKYLLFDKPSADNIKDMFAKTNSSHPRIIMSADDLDRVKRLYSEGDPYIKKWGDQIIEDASAMFGKAEYTYDIVSSNMNDVAYAVDDIKNLAMAYYLTGNTRYVARAWTFMKNICELTTWNPMSYLDVGELTAILAIGYDWLYNVLTEEQRTYLAKTIYERGVEYTNRIYYNQLPSTEAYTSWWNATNNWNAVCNGGVMLGAMAIFESYPDTCADFIRNASRALEYMMPQFYPDGAWAEGGGYWNYALQYTVYTIASFQNTLGDDLGFIDTPGFSNTGWFGTSLSGSTGFNNFGDNVIQFINNPQVMWCANEFNDSVLASARITEMENLGHRGTVADMIYYNPELLGADSSLPLDTRSPGVEVVGLREKWYDQGSTFLGFNGGSAMRSHGHLDLGTFVVDMAGERIISDPGAESYSASGYFSTKRFDYYRARPEGHNIYVINPTNSPDDYGIDRNAFALTTDPVSKNRGAYSSVDLTESYQRDVTKAVRGYMLTDDRRNVLVRDEIDLKGESDIYWFLHTKAEIEMEDKNTAVLNLNGKKIKVQILTNASSYTFGPAEAAPLPTSPQITQSNNASSNLRKLTLNMKANGHLTVTVKISQYDDPAANNPIPDINIADWTLPDGEVTPLPTADMIYADGVALEDFDSFITGYNTLCPKKQEAVPVITVAAKHRYEVMQSKEFGVDTIVKVYSDTDPSVYRVYRINFYKLPPLSDVNGMTRYGVAEVTASDVPQEENAPVNVIDQDFGTRWSANGAGHWIQLELEDVYTIDRIGVSFMNGDARVTPYKLELSEDGVNYTEVFNGKSLGTTSSYEFRDISSKKAKYVKLTVYGNNVTTWNSVTEFAALGKR